CTDSTIKTIKVYPIPAATFDTTPLSTCLADTIARFSATYSYAWPDPISLRWFVNGQPVGVGSVLNYQFRLPPGAARPYTFTIKLLPQNVAGCGDSLAGTTLTIKPVPRPGIKVLPGYVQQQPQRVFSFSDSMPANPNYIYNWDLGDRSPIRYTRSFTHQYPDTGTYRVKLRVHDFSSSCSGSDSAKVTVLYVPGYLYVPNAFYPGSQKAELKEFRPIGIGLEQYHLRIYDTWGRLLFESRLLDPDGKPTESWNGIDDKKKDMGGDVYVWVIDAVFKNGQKWQGMVYDKNPNSGPPHKPSRQGFVRVLR
ncbi:MAG: gliding motility-associated C-terminal domain-containing protein, partial [Dinghuibacter sp.]|nr:gliding motility-associated C-terminal domain-containing protein [Dinghuibacter sp.]